MTIYYTRNFGLTLIFNGQTVPIGVPQLEAMDLAALSRYVDDLKAYYGSPAVTGGR